MSFDARRIADDAVYLSESRYENPKETFKFVAGHIKEAGYAGGSSLLDIGAATGEFLYYLRKELPDFGYLYGMDPSEKMIQEAMKNVSGADFFRGSIFDYKLFKERRYDVVTCINVMSIFDEFESPLRNIFACLREGGLVLILSLFNDDPIDVRMAYRRSSNADKGWEKGWNIFSFLTVERILNNSGYGLKWSWHPFRLPFTLKKRPEDPMRAWTITTKDDPYQQVNGACQLLNFKMLKIHILKLPLR